jgi:hypothetical protein
MVEGEGCLESPGAMTAGDGCLEEPSLVTAGDGCLEGPSLVAAPPELLHEALDQLPLRPCNRFHRMQEFAYVRDFLSQPQRRRRSSAPAHPYS